jgi:hypothetical protein
MKRKKLCILCRQRPAEVPDRQGVGRPIKTVCRQCHAERLGEDLRRIAELSKRKGELH